MKYIEMAIDVCRLCPFMYEQYSDLNGGYFCTNCENSNNVKISDVDDIPYWCPLPDLKEPL